MCFFVCTWKLYVYVGKFALSPIQPPTCSFSNRMTQNSVRATVQWFKAKLEISQSPLNLNELNLFLSTFVYVQSWLLHASKELKL